MIQHQSIQMSRVFSVLKSTRFDVSSARTFGDVVPLFSNPSLINPMAGQSTYDTIADELESNGFNADRDFIVLTGPIALVVFLATAAASLSPSGQVRFLLFDARTNTYRERTVNTLEEVGD